MTSRARPRASAARRPSPPRTSDSDQIHRGIQSAINSGQIIAVGLPNLVRNTIVTALAGAKDIGAEIGTGAVTAVRGSIRRPTASTPTSGWWRARRSVAPSSPPATSGRADRGRPFGGAHSREDDR
jgi:hypothetical protein